MAKLYFNYSTMNAGKSIEALKVAYNYKERSKKVLLFTSSLDNRYGEGVIASRIGISQPAISLGKNDKIPLSLVVNDISCVIVDEAQFLTKEQVLDLVKIVDDYDVPVMCYGLKNDFRNEMFEGSYYLLLYADKIREIKTICHCGRKATMVARVIGGKKIDAGDQVQIGGNESYISLCRKHYMREELK